MNAQSMVLIYLLSPRNLVPKRERERKYGETEERHLSDWLLGRFLEKERHRGREWYIDNILNNLNNYIYIFFKRVGRSLETLDSFSCSIYRGSVIPHAFSCTSHALAGDRPAFRHSHILENQPCAARFACQFGCRLRVQKSSCFHNQLFGFNTILSRR